MRRFLLCGAAALLIPAGCVAHVDSHSSHPHGGPPGQTKKVVVVESSHVCYDSCDHFFIDGTWYIETGHRHGSGCGHYLVKGKWGHYKEKDDDKNQDKDKDKGKGKGKDKD